ncbi:hypothetical protein [Nitrobacter sp. TKz-YC01]|uniref:hypothetical protein n=1 Tax=Nitrobacter sp. TKz-YC01 TaxID=3398703 RepID=UPI003A0FF65A
MTDTTERAELLAERSELIAKNEAATSWGAAAGARSERIKEIDRQLAALRRVASQDQKPPPAAGWDIPDQITPELACIMENCDGPEMQTGEAVAALVRGYQPTWTKIVAALSRQPAAAETNASAEARLMVIDECSDALGYRREYLRTLLSAHPHASDCDKQGETRPANCRFRLQDEGKSYPRSSCSACGKNIATGLGNRCKESPSDRTADVTVKVRSAINGIYGLRFCQFSGGHQEDSIEKAIKKIVAIVEEPRP